jgi:hypothetical protein
VGFDDTLFVFLVNFILILNSVIEYNLFKSSINWFDKTILRGAEKAFSRLTEGFFYCGSFGREVHPERNVVKSKEAKRRSRKVNLKIDLFCFCLT